MRTWPWLLLLALGCSETGFRSPDPPPYTLAHAPDAEPEFRTDVIVQHPAQSADVLFVIDNSCSMGDDQIRLAQNMPGLFAAFSSSGLDFHLGVVSTDVLLPSHSGHLQGVPGYLWIDQHTPDPVPKFRDMVLLGSGGYSPESGLLASYLALGPDINQGFYRADYGTALHVIYISDEPDQSIGLSTTEFVSWLQSQKSLVTASAIVHLYDDYDCDAYGFGEGYIEVAEATGGVTRSICADDWSSLVDDIGALVTGPPREFFLSGNPVEDTVEVTVEAGAVTVAPPFEYNRQRNSVALLDYTPPPLARIRVRYELAAGP